MAHAFPNMSAEASNHLSRFIDAFVEKRKRDRWRTVMALAPEKWHGASAYECVVKPLGRMNTTEEHNILSAGLEVFLDRPAFMFTIGAAAGWGYKESTLRKAILGEDWRCESIVSVVPGQLAVCYGHSGEVRVCRRDAG